jgi:hypothetical protein
LAFAIPNRDRLCPSLELPPIADPTKHKGRRVIDVPAELFEQLTFAVVEKLQDCVASQVGLPPAKRGLAAE